MPFGDDDTPELTDEVATGRDGAGGDAGENTGADTSDAPGATEDEGLLGVVRDAVAEKKPETEAASPADGDEAGKEPDAEAPKQQDDEEYSDVPFNKHPRFRKLLAERNSFKTDAEQYRTVQTFISDNGLSSQEAADLLVTGAMAKTNPAKAWELAKPWVEKVLAAAGETLTDDLAQMVRDGAMTREAAFEVSRARAAVQSTEASRSFEQQRAEQRAAEDEANTLRTEVQTWKQERWERDPNYAAKEELIQKEIVYREHKGLGPRDKAGIRKFLDDIYKDVNASFAPVTPPAPAPNSRRALTPVVGGSVAGTPRPKPRNMLEVVQQATAGA